MVDDEMRGHGTDSTFGEDVIPLSMVTKAVYDSVFALWEDFPAAEAWLNGDE
jgi:hypothetical protein